MDKGKLGVQYPNNRSFNKRTEKNEKKSLKKNSRLKAFDFIEKKSTCPI